MDTADVVEESWQQAAKQRIAEKQEEVRSEQGKQEKRSFGNPSVQLKMRAGVDSGRAVEDLVDSILFSDLQDVECLAWWKKMEPSLIAKGPDAGVALVALAKR